MSYSYEMDMGGVVEIMKSAAVKAELGRLAEGKAAEANRLLRARNRRYKGAGYETRIKSAGMTSVAQVHPTDKTSLLDHQRHRTLDAVNH